MKTFSQFLNEILTIRGEEPKPLPPEPKSKKKLSTRKLLAALGLLGPLMGQAADRYLNPKPDRVNIPIMPIPTLVSSEKTNEEFKRRSKKMV